jgi:DNA polymerase-3 subunit delta'
MSEEGEETAAEPLPIEFLPWHADANEHLRTAIAGARLSHGLLLHGPQGVGKERFAAALAAALFCTRRGSSLVACGECNDCRLSRAGSHPDLHWVRLLKDAKGEKEKKSIGVDQIRQLGDDLAMTSMRSGYRVAVVAPADLMTQAAQNALLKTLEEPGARTVIVLVTARPSALLATLRSRSQRIEIARPDAGTALVWLRETLGEGASEPLLALAGGAPLKALSLAPHFDALESQMGRVLEALLSHRAEVTELAADMVGEGLPTRLDWLEGWLGGAIRSRAAGDETPLTVRGTPLLQRAAAAVNITAAFQIVDRLREARRLLAGSAAPQLLVEVLLIELRAAVAR